MTQTTYNSYIIILGCFFRKKKPNNCEVFIQLRTYLLCTSQVTGQCNCSPPHQLWFTLLTANREGKGTIRGIKRGKWSSYYWSEHSGCDKVREGGTGSELLQFITNYSPFLAARDTASHQRVILSPRPPGAWGLASFSKVQLTTVPPSACSDLKSGRGLILQ